MRPKPTCSQGRMYSDYNDLLKWYEEVLSNSMVQRILDIPTKGPIFILDARDIYAPETIDFWLGLAQRTVSIEKFGRAVQDYQEMIEWQTANPERVKIPD